MIGTSVLWAGALVALLLAFIRTPIEAQAAGRERMADLFAIGLAAHCLHCVEEFVTDFPGRFPALFDLDPWPRDFYVVFNLVWLSIWILSVAGIKRGTRAAYFPAWFFAIGSIANGIGHPALSIVAGGYFPGLITSPLVGVLGAMLFLRLGALTRPLTVWARR